MSTRPQHIYVERIDPAKNMARFYAMEISSTLFGGIRLTRIWGRIGQRGQTKMHFFDQESEARDLFADLMRSKSARGYRPPSR